ncbi:DUF6311 domain-containing protein [Asticcacaulis endophyticus]|uniref:Membrane protein 6-pyruvoyl-tetrahydropterin synthase-related domain-containing protein n=1 Tax=Asticcacaulis endophyticus TaxID=1395890 RepID=A0A918Q2T0_9CAUL|nr:DUF6311 domain-containing protein [Asticcacaulis endophyticus]GGZ29269.1 hypothetical protein GCM10011273_14130 [Asticcacaulis endophyticus]
MPDNSSAPYHTVLKFAAPILLFLLFFTPDMLDPTNVGWLMRGDWAQHFLGWHAYRNGADGFNHQNLLGYPTGQSVIYTDSNPFLAFPFKLISPLLPDYFQYIGPWFLLCICLHYFIACRLVSRHAPGPWSALAGAVLLTLLPTLYGRIGHDTLVAHWLILAAIYIFFEIGDEKRKWIAYSVLLALCGFIHPYILVMVLAIWGADWLRVLGPQWQAKDIKGLGVSGLKMTLTLLAPIIALAISGAFSGSSAKSGGFGLYSMGLDAPFNPSNKSFMLPFLSVQQDEGQAFEGFQYLGLGLLFLIGAAIWLYRKSEDSRTVKEVLIKARPLKWPMIALLVLAISNKIQIYDILILKLPLPDFLEDLFNIVRASGRLFWPIAYLMVFLALLTLYRSRPKTMTIVLSVAVVLQFMDLAGFATQIKGLTARASDRTVFTIAKSPEWDKLIKDSDLVSFQAPSVHSNQPLFYEVTMHAVSNKVPVNTMYAARDNLKQSALEYEEYKRYQSGQLNPRHLYVMLNKCPAPKGAEHRLRALDGIWIIPPLGLETGLKTIPQVPTFEINKPHPITWDSPAACLFGQGWRLPERVGVWTEGARAEVNLALPTPALTAMTLDINARAMKAAQVDVFANGVPVGRFEMLKKDADYSVTIPQAVAAQSQTLNIRFVVTPPKAPQKDLKPEHLRLNISSLTLKTT